MILKNGHYQICLPFRDDDITLPNNETQAIKRLASLRKKMLRNKTFSDEYIAFMKSVIEHGYAEVVPNEDLVRTDGKVWYRPHHGIYHPQKQKLRVVFDCAAKFQGVSLNDVLLQGPDVTNNLVDVLLRFRRESIAIRGDIDSMFYQVKVPREDCD